jgi:hypothetical protein
VAPGHLPARATLDPAAPLELVVGGPSPAIEGRVVDAAGEPVPGAFVWCVDPTPAGVGLEAWFLETHVNPDRGAPIPFVVEADGEGRFVLPWLLERVYRVGALDRTSFQAGFADVAAGARDVVLRVASDDPVAPVLGRVLDASGAPVVGARGSAPRAKTRIVDADGRTLTSSFRYATRVTDADGWFGLPPLPERSCMLDVVAEGFCAATPEIPTGLGREHVEIVLARQRVLEVSWSGAAGDATHFVVLDEDDRVLDLLAADDDLGGYGLVPAGRERLVAGAARLVRAPDTGRTLVVVDGERVVARVPIAWAAEGPTRIDLQEF